MEDIWGDEEVGEGQQGLDREWQARRGEHFNSGYREGLEAGKHETVQEGFDQGYAQGTTAGWECGAARGSAATLRAVAPRMPQLAARLQEAQQPQQQGGLEDVPYQQLQRRVCESLMAAAGGSSGSDAGQQGAANTAASPAQLLPLPPDVVSALQATRATIKKLGLQAPAQHMVNGV